MPLTLAVISTSRIVDEFLANAAAMPEISVQALCCRPQSRPKAEAWAAQYGIPAVYTDEDACYAVGGFDDLVDVVNALLVLDFGDDLHAFGTHMVEKVPDILDILGAAGEGGGDKVKAVFCGKEDIAAVLLGQERQVHGGSGEVEALAVPDGAAV